MNLPAAPSLPANKIRSLDGLRAVSIALVLLGHLHGTAGFPDLGLSRLASDYASLGVRVFFVISGFLITRLLLQEREQYGSISLRLFYARRALRIVPAFFAYMAVMLAASAAGLVALGGRDVAFAFTWTVNFQPHPPWHTGHLWSLSVEEQFYLLWPFTVAALTPVLSTRAAAACLLLGPFSRAALVLVFPQWLDVPIFPAVADALAAGCLLALLRERLWDVALYRRVMHSGAAIALLAASVFAISPLRRYMVVWVAGEAAINIAIALVIDWCVSWPDRGAARLLNTRPLVWTGLLSYSLYLWQQPFLNRHAPGPLTSFPVNILAAVACASASYYLLEKPFMRMRGRLRRQPAAATVAAAAEPL